MFEIIMLLAFLYAATSQFFPERPTTTRTQRVKKGRHDEEKIGLVQRPAQKSQTTPAPSSKVKNLHLRYAQVA